MATRKLKIAIYTICKNEEQFVDRWAKSNHQADYRLVCDTGSTDKTVSKLRDHGVIVYPITVNPWRFDFARNASLNLLPADIDLCIWQDLDEELLEGWRENLEQVYDPEITQYNHRYRHNGRPWQWHNKIHPRHNCIWQGAVHEKLIWFVPEKDIMAGNIYLDENQDITKPRSSYKDLLLKKVEEGHVDWRTYFFLSIEYGGDIIKAIEARTKSYELCEDDDITKSHVAKSVANLYSTINDNKNAVKWYNIATDHSNERETWFYYCYHHYKRKEWDKCYIYSQKCINVHERRNGFTYDERAWSAEIFDMGAIAAYNLGLKDKAFELGSIAAKMNPEDERLQQNLKYYIEGIEHRVQQNEEN